MNRVEDNVLTCFSCGVKVEGASESLEIFNTLLNDRAWVPGAGYRREGMGVPCRDGLTDIRRLDKNKNPLRCLVREHGEEYFEQQMAEIDEQYPDRSSVPKERWRKAYQRVPSEHAAHYVMRLGKFHTYTETKDGRTFVTHEPCVNGILGKTKRPMICRGCKEGAPIEFGLVGFWNPSMPAGDADTAKGQLAKLMRLEAEEISQHSPCGGFVRPTAYMCSVCESPVFDMEDQDNPVDELEVEAVLAQIEANLVSPSEPPFICPHCGQAAELYEELEAVYWGYPEGHEQEGMPIDGDPTSDPEGQWWVSSESPRRLSYFDVDLCVRRTGRELATELDIVGWRIAPEVADMSSIPLQHPVFEFQHVEPRTPEMVEKMEKLPDLKFLIDIGLPQQAKLMHVELDEGEESRPAVSYRKD